jgi:hypothetical protein
MGKKARTAAINRLAEPSPDGGRVLAATASRLGEDFDCPPLDTLFHALPIKFRAAASSTTAAPSAQPTRRHASRTTITATPKSRCWLACTTNALGLRHPGLHPAPPTPAHPPPRRGDTQAAQRPRREPASLTNASRTGRTVVTSNPSSPRSPPEASRCICERAVLVSRPRRGRPPAPTQQHRRLIGEAYRQPSSAPALTPTFLACAHPTR